MEDRDRVQCPGPRRQRRVVKGPLEKGKQWMQIRWRQTSDWPTYDNVCVSRQGETRPLTKQKPIRSPRSELQEQSMKEKSRRTGESVGIGEGRITLDLHGAARPGFHILPAVSREQNATEIEGFV